MIDPVQHNPVGRFEGLASIYDRYRPDYADSAIHYILSRAELNVGDCIADVGCGTGISSRLMARYGLKVVGVEPNADMRRQAQAAAGPAESDLIYREGRAEATGLPANSVDGVLAAQAFHWFSPAESLPEFIRILKPGRWIILIWNEPDRYDPATREYMRLLEEHSPEPEVARRVQSRTGDVLLTWPALQQADRVEFTHAQRLDRPSLQGRALSASYAPKDPEARSRFCQSLDMLFDQFQSKGEFKLHYRTPVYSARKPAAI